MKIYIVTSGEYSDYTIRAVFDDRAKAETYLSRFPNGDAGFEIEEWDTEAPIAILFQYRLSIYRDGRIFIREANDEPSPNAPTIGTLLPINEWESGEAFIFADVLARDQAHAVKIGGEIRTQVIAANKWPADKGKRERGADEYGISVDQIHSLTEVARQAGEGLDRAYSSARTLLGGDE